MWAHPSRRGGDLDVTRRICTLGLGARRVIGFGGLGVPVQYHTTETSDEKNM